MRPQVGDRIIKMSRKIQFVRLKPHSHPSKSMSVRLADFINFDYIARERDQPERVINIKPIIDSHIFQTKVQ